MSTEQELKILVDEIQSIVTSVSRTPSINGPDLRRVLKFISKVVQVVDQAFQDVYTTLIEFKYLTPKEMSSDRLVELRKELDLLRARDRYRDAEQICSRLHFLGEQYQSQIQPIVRQVEDHRSWYQVFRLFDEHENRIIGLVDDTVRELQDILDGKTFYQAKTIDINIFAAQKVAAIRVALVQLNALQNRILGLSGEDGFLELTATYRYAIEREVNIFLDQSNRNITQNISGNGNIGAIGQNISQSINMAADEQLSVADVLSLIDKVQKTIENENLPQVTKERAARQLDETKAEMKEEKPDKDFIANTLKKTTEMLSQAGALITTSSTLGKLLLPLAQWLGKTTGWFGF